MRSSLRNLMAMFAKERYCINTIRQLPHNLFATGMQPIALYLYLKCFLNCYSSYYYSSYRYYSRCP